MSTPPSGGGAPPVPTPTPHPPRSVLDAAALARLSELDPDGRHGVVMRVLAAFETSLARMLQQLTAQRDDGDAGVVSTIAHTLKSSSASVGALALARACTQVERRLHDGLPGKLGADVELLLREGESAMVAVGSMLRP